MTANLDNKNHLEIDEKVITLRPINVGMGTFSIEILMKT